MEKDITTLKRVFSMVSSALPGRLRLSNLTGEVLTELMERKGDTRIICTHCNYLLASVERDKCRLSVSLFLKRRRGDGAYRLIMRCPGCERIITNNNIILSEQMEYMKWLKEM